jgi:hypothetical protein
MYWRSLRCGDAYECLVADRVMDQDCYSEISGRADDIVRQPHDRLSMGETSSNNLAYDSLVLSIISYALFYPQIPQMS